MLGVPFTYVSLERRLASWEQQTWLEHGIEMSGSRKEMHGIFCTSASLKGSRILFSMLVCGSVHLHRCAAAIYTNALSQCSSAQSETQHAL